MAAQNRCETVQWRLCVRQFQIIRGVLRFISSFSEDFGGFPGKANLPNKNGGPSSHCVLFMDTTRRLLSHLIRFSAASRLYRLDIADQAEDRFLVEAYAAVDALHAVESCI